MRQRRSARGMSLIELMVGIAIVGVLTVLVAPSFTDWMRNTRIRSAAEALRSDLQMARTEAIRMNTSTRLQFVTTLTASCALSTSGPYWVVNAGASVTPAGACANALSTTTSPYLLRKSPVSSAGASDLALTATRTTVGFDSLGRQMATTTPTSSISTLTVTLTSASGTCVASNGTVRCLKVIVSPAGDARICDPTRTSTTDPLTC